MAHNGHNGFGAGFTYGIGNFDVVSTGETTRKVIKEMIDDNNLNYVDKEIDKVNANIQRVEWLTDDVHVLPTRSDFPGKPGAPVKVNGEFRCIPTEPIPDGYVGTDDIYQASDSGVQYIFVADNSLLGGYYKVVSETRIEKQDIIDIVK